MAKSKIKPKKMVRVQLGAAVTATVGGVKFVNGRGIVPEKTAKAKGWKIIEEVNPVEKEPPAKPKLEPTKKDKPKGEPAFEPAPEDN